VAAAFAAASKIEGVVLAVSLIAVHLLRRLREGAFRERRLGVPALARIVLPSLLVVLPWLAIDLRHGLFQPANSGPFEIARWPGVVAALGEAVAVRPWHGMSVLILATPLLLVFARTRALAGVILVQLAFYLWVFFTQVGDPEVLVRTSFPRLLLPLLPAVIVGFLAVSASRSRAGP